MSLDTLVAVVVTFFWILPTAGQTDPTGINLVEEFKHSRPFFKQIKIGKQIIALRDTGLLENLKDVGDRDVTGIEINWRSRSQ